MKANPVDIFNYVVETLPDKESLSIDCDTEAQLDRIRMALYRQRNKLEKIAPGIASIITISKRVEGKSFSIIIGKNIERVDLFTFDKKGKKVPITIETKDEDLNKERMKALMRKDGKSEEDIEEYFQRN